MSDTVHIVANSLGSNNRVAVIFMGELEYNGGPLNGKDFHTIFSNLNGAAEYIHYHETDDPGMEHPNKVVYGDDDE